MIDELKSGSLSLNTEFRSKNHIYHRDLEALDIHGDSTKPAKISHPFSTFSVALPDFKVGLGDEDTKIVPSLLG